MPQTPAQQETIERVMGEFKHGDLEQRNGEPVTNPKQAIAIALHEAGASNREDAAANRRNLRRTKQRERAADETKAALYEQAKHKGVTGRSKMSKAELIRAVHG